MALVALSRVNTVSRIYRIPYTDTAGMNDPPDQRFLPPGVSGISRLPSIEKFSADGNSWALIVGAHCDNIAQLRDFNFVRQGIRAPAQPPTVAAGAGPGVTGSAICYCRFLDQPNNRRSPLSEGTAAVTLTNQSRAWTNIPTIPPDEVFYIRGTTTVNASQTVNLTTGELLTEVLQVGDQVAVSSAPTTWVTVLTVASDSQFTTSAAIGNGTTQTITVRRAIGVTHVELVVSMDGGTPRVAMTVALGQTTVTEAVATLALGAAATESFSKFPLCFHNAIYHQRQWMAGDYLHPERVYYSLVNDPENMESYMETRNGAPVRALWKLRDSLYVGTDRDIQVIQGYTSEDFAIEVAEPDIVVLNHQSIGKADNMAIVPTTRTIYLHATGFTSLLDDKALVTWQSCIAGSNIQYWYDSWAVIDPVDGVYKLLSTSSGTSSPRMLDALARLGSKTYATMYWVLDLTSMARFGSPQLMFDVRGRTDTCAFRIIHPLYGEVVVTGSSDGKFRIELPYSDDEDDQSDTYKKRWIVVPKHYFEGHEGGEPQKDGRRWTAVWLYVEGEANTWSVDFYAGDENALWQTSSDFGDSVPPSYDARFVAKSLHYYTPDSLQGRGLTIKLVADSAPSRTGSIRSPALVWRGWGAYHGPGTSTRKSGQGGGGGG